MSLLRLCAVLAWLALVLAVLAVTRPAHADYLEVRHSALLKQSPKREAKTRVKLSVGEQLELTSNKQTNGYYCARTRSGTQGYIYRTLARRFAGELPDAEEPEPEPEPEPDAPDSDLVEEGPTNLEPEIPAYSRKAWRHWVDDDRDCQSTRQEVLIEESLSAQAFQEFQDPLNPPERLDGGLGWVARYGDLAILAVDGRTHRNWSSGTILGRSQLDALELKLNGLSGPHFKHLFVVVGTPVVFVLLLAAEKLAGMLRLEGLDDIRDGWSSSNNRAECRRFLMSLLNFAGFSPNTQVTLVAGDIHVGTLGQIDTDLGFGPDRISPRIYQVTASGIGRPSPAGVSAFALNIIRKFREAEHWNICSRAFTD